MEEAGILRDGNTLNPQIRRIVGENRTVTDLTSTEIKEIIGGYYMVVANDFDAVQEIAQDFPDYDLGGTVEIREVTDLEQ
ncbi:YciI family protein [Kordia sp.]|uniref:YciI family protein n=1 Tax=Kordia sp. TaxID=1965332 RepID=UPI0025C58C68|nr:YciI family protein [Kordia sp.]MCH2196310.1 YciI family protein [Kordia sp.]